ncbi:MAG: UDP-N-acetylmuramoyl-L-alanine--D-glutamate ligase [Nocardioidaceae bacterium]|nr:UDP-N-acetylmuramoyl-L-alanine--D-glutamate ligase [Nocardioidaceae bacterium]
MRWPGTEVVVAGIGVSGYAAAQALLDRGARVTVLDERDDDQNAERAARLERRGASVRLGADAAAAWSDDAELVVASPGWPPRAPLLVQAARRGVEVWSEVELAWRLRGPDPAPWLCVTGTNGKTTTVTMLASMLGAAGLRTAAIGNVGTPVTEAVVSAERFDVLAVELSSFQLHRTASLSASAAAILNLAPDHLDWYAGSLEVYTADKASIYRNAQLACVYNADDAVIERLAGAADVAPGCRLLGFTTGPPVRGVLGIDGDSLVDAAFAGGGGEKLAQLGDVVPAAPHNIANALAAAALARAHGVPASAVGAGLRQYRPGAHRITEVATLDGVRYVDDSKATNPHAALASLRAYDAVVWVAGGLAKGADFTDLVRATRDRLRAVVLLGADRATIADAMARHAPDVPVVVVDRRETGDVMDHVVEAAAAMSRPGDTVLLAPGCASQDMFRDYGARGDAFTAAVRRRQAGHRPGEDVSR